MLHCLRQLILLLALLHLGRSLDCIQCDMSGKWYSEEEHERHVEMCQQGDLEPTSCSNRSHTHCIVSWFRSGGDTERTVTERRCGTKEDDTGCTLYNAKINRKVRHLLNNKEENRRDGLPIFVEVCSESCDQGRCNSSPALIWTTSLLLFSFF